MSFRFLFRKPIFPVIIVAEDRVFRAATESALQSLLNREVGARDDVLLVDARWAWFQIYAEQRIVGPSFIRSRPPTKQQLIEVVDGRSNRSEDDPRYRPGSLSSRKREEIFRKLVSILPAD